MANSSMTLLSVHMLALLANIAFSNVEHCAPEVTEESNPKNKMSYIQHVSTKTENYEATHLAWYGKGDAPVSIALAKKTSDSPKNIIQYRFFDEVKGGEPELKEVELDDVDEDLTFVWVIGSTSLFEVSRDLYVVTENDKELQVTKIKPTDPVNDIFGSQTVTFSEFDFMNFVGVASDGITVSTSWQHIKNKTYHTMATELSSVPNQPSYTYISGTIVPQDDIQIGFLSDVLAFDVTNRQYYRKNMSDLTSVNLIKLENDQLSQYNLRPILDPSLGDYELSPIYMPDYSKVVTILRAHMHTGTGMIFRTAIDTQNGVGFPDEAIPDFSTPSISTPSEDAEVYIGPHGQLIEVYPTDKYCSLIMLAKSEDSDNPYVLSYLQGQVFPDDFPINEILQITSNFRRVFIFTEKTLEVLEVEPTQTEKIQGYEFAVEELTLGENILLIKKLHIEKETRHIVKNQFPAYTVIVDKCFCSKVTYSDFNCFQSGITCVVATNYHESDCTDEAAFAGPEVVPEVPSPLP